jgi:transposase-like protein
MLVLNVTKDNADLEKKKPPKTESARQFIAYVYGVLKTAKKSPICASSYVGDAGIPLNIPALIVSLFASVDAL